MCIKCNQNMKNIMYIKYNFQQFILIFINKKFVFKYPIKKDTTLVAKKDTTRSFQIYGQKK